MSTVRLCMAMSLDGFIAGPNDVANNGLGDNGERLHDWLGSSGTDGETGSETGPESFRPDTEPSRTVFDEMLTTGAVITGRRTGEMVNYWDGDHHNGVPIFVPTHRTGRHGPANVTFVTDGIASCVKQAKAAAGDRDVMLHGANTAQECLRAGVLDEIELQLVPVLLGAGRRLFDGLGPEHIELELIRTLEATDVLHLRYRVVTS